MRRSILVLLLLASVGWGPAPAWAADAAVHVTNFAFAPASATIQAGDAVNWSFDEGTHSVVFDQGAGAPEGCPEASAGASCSRTFATAGTFGYHCGIHASMTGTVVVEGASSGQNQPPAVVFHFAVDNLSVAFDATMSSDPDGTIASYAWEWGDGETGAGAQPNHTYAAAGTYAVNLTVTDDAGATANVTHDVAVQAPQDVVPQPPVAEFEANVSGLTVVVDAAASSDPDGSIVSYAWDWGDGGNGTGAQANHTYAGIGSYTITLTVTDDAALNATKSLAVGIGDSLDEPPVADFSFALDGLRVRVNASTSTDREGAIEAYDWDWGDGGPHGAGIAPNHTYAAPGAYTINLTVVDGGGQNASASQEVVLLGKASREFALETLGLLVRVNASGMQNASGATFEWDFGDGATGSGPVAQHAYALAGSYAIRLVVEGATGPAVNVTRNVTLALFDAKATGLSVAFNATRVPGASGANVSWDFGDHQRATGLRVTHRYTAPGSYEVTLRLASATLNATLTRSVAVSAAAPKANASSNGSVPAGAMESSSEIPLAPWVALAAVALAAVTWRKR